MKTWQKVVHVSATNYEKLEEAINDCIGMYPYSVVQQIDYFRMKAEECGLCSAFILFRPE